MAGGLFSRLNTRTTGGTITAADDDNDWDNIINNLLPAKFDDYSLNNAQMQSTRDPYPGDTISLSSNLAEELEGIRFIFKQITGEAQWYIDPDTDLATVLAHYSDTTTHGITGDIVGTTDTQTLSAKTLTTPTIGDFSNAAHDHVDAAGGGIATTIRLQTPVAVASGSSVSLNSSVPATAKRIMVHINGVSTTGGTSDIYIRIGDSGGIESSGYISTAQELTAGAGQTSTASTTEFLVATGVAAANVYYGTCEINLQDATNFNYTYRSTLANSGAADLVVAGGFKSLTTILTQLQIATGDTFDGSGEVSVSWE